MTIGGIAAICLIAGGIVAAALTRPLPDRETAGGGLGGGGGGSSIGGPPPASGEPLRVTTVPWIGEVVLFVLVVSILLIIAYVGVYRKEYRPLLATIIVLSLAVFVILEVFTTSTADATPILDLIALLADGTAGDTGPRLFSDGPGSLVVLLLATLVVLAIVIGRSRWLSGSHSESPGGDDERADTDTEAIAQVAGRMADRMESTTGFENDVFRAWREMTRLLAVGRAESMTPGEFAREAIAVGMQPRDVQDLTRLFEDVRYGGYQPTGDREERARRLFRRIEETYGSSEQ